jgi:hypothetical protein
MTGTIRLWLYAAALLVGGALLLAACGSQAPETTTTAPPAVTLTSPALAASSTSPPQAAPTLIASATIAPLPEDTATPLPASTSAPPPEDTVTPLPAPTSAPPPVSEGEGNADIVHVRAIGASDGRWTFQVTVQHPDTGWEDYADGWDVVIPDGTVLKSSPGDSFTRLLAHPHVDEQPFTRSQSGILIPEGVTLVRVRAHDLVDGFGGREVVVDLTISEGPDFEVEAP